MLPTHDVDCPICGKRIYTAISLEDVIPADAPAMPKVQTDEHGDFLSCPHCDARVAMKRVITKAGAVFRPAGSN